MPVTSADPAARLRTLGLQRRAVVLTQGRRKPRRPAGRRGPLAYSESPA